MKEETKTKAAGGTSIVAVIIAVVGAVSGYTEMRTAEENSRAIDQARVQNTATLQAALTEAVKDLESTNVELRVSSAELAVRVGALERALEHERDMSLLLMEEAREYEMDEVGSSPVDLMPPDLLFGAGPMAHPSDEAVAKSTAERVVKKQKKQSATDRVRQQLIAPAPVFK